MLGIRRRIRAVSRRLVRKAWRKPAPTILMYHRIAEPPYDPWGLAVSPELFADQLRSLTRSRKLVHMDRLVEGLRRGGLTGKEVAITFDDGYVDNLTTGKPILERAEAPATVFITTDRLGAAREFWWDELAHMCLGGTAAIDAGFEIAGRRLHVSLPARTAAVSSDWFWSDPPTGDRERMYLMLWKTLQRLDDGTREAAMQTLREQFGEPFAPAASLPMRREDVGTLVADGLIHVGGHSHAHLPLTTLSADAKRHQIERCKRELEELTQSAVSGFAYPFGDRDDEAKALTKGAGYCWAVSTHSAVVDAKDCDLFDLPRLQAMNWTGSELMRRLTDLGQAP
jgi:peptidoglycan/xylan/chitin deacetylase (PgdA/CDA1 family)